MNLLIFTPTSQKSAVARMACIVTKALIKQGHCVKIVRTEVKEKLAEPPYPFDADIFHWNYFRIPSLISVADGIVYHIGDHYGYHKGALAWLNKAPGIVCLHDYFIGEEIANEYYSYLPDYFIMQASRKAPLTEWVASQALGVITHSNWGIQRVLVSCPGPVHVIPLPFKVFEADNYALKLATMIKNCFISKPVLECIDHFAKILHTWDGIEFMSMLFKDHFFSF
jgi:hypothetical protein